MVARQYDEIKNDVEAACLRVGRKTGRSDFDRCQQDKPVEMLREAYEAGARETLERIRYRRF